MTYFSIVLPLYNKQTHILDALISITNQTYSNYEVIIINDGSTDNSEEIVLDWIASLDNNLQDKFNIYSQKNSGVSSARNNGAKKARYEYITFLDCDDYWKNNHLLELNLLIGKYSTQVDIFSNYCIQLKDNEFIYPKLAKYSSFFGVVDYFEVSMISNGFVNSSSVCVKKESIDKHPFPEDMKNFEDVVTWARIANNKGLAFSSKPTSVYVIGNAEASSNIDFTNYIKYEKLLISETTYKKIALYSYCFKFLLIHLLFAKMNMKTSDYLYEIRKIFAKSFLISISAIISLIFPKYILNKLKNIRKN